MKKTVITITLWIATSIVAVPQQKNTIPYLRVPVVDLNGETFRQVVVDKEDNQYLGHPTTVMLDDNKTILTVYPKGHGKGEIVLKKSNDGGLTWSERMPVPESWKTSKETPTIHKLQDETGKTRLIVFSGLYPVRISYSEDEGHTWTELEKAGDWGGVVVMSALIELTSGKGHYMGMFHDDLRFLTEKGHSEFYKDKKFNALQPFTLYKTYTYDGGKTWTYPVSVYTSRQMSLCEPCLIRSPDNKQLALLLRENSRMANSQIMFSNDEGLTWTDPRPLPNELTGDRHVGKYSHDGRLVIVFRDISPISYRKDLEKLTGNVNFSDYTSSSQCGSPTEGDWVAWIGSWEDLENNKPGQYRLRLKKNNYKWDCGYSGLEVLPNKTFVTTSYGRWEDSNKPYIMSVRFNLKEIDKKAKSQMKKKRPSKKANTDLQYIV